ncbi:hypothetical protein OB920_20425 [Halobacteria archaeon HArc-gm2]|nr:hypothetical protein [Halobacteria archaeon HArc-gm2]
MKQDKKQNGNNLINRRTLIRSGATLGAAGLVPNVAAAGERTPIEKDDSDRIDLELINEKDDHKLFRIDNKERISLGKFYTSGPKEGKVEHVNIRDKSANSKVDADIQKETTESVLSTDSSGTVSVNEVAAQDAMSMAGVEIVKRSKNIDRGLDSCTKGFCDGFTYKHVQTGFTVEFVDQISSFGSTILEEAIAVLIETYVATKWSRWMLGFVSIIVGTLLVIATGVSATISPWDREKTGSIRGTRAVIEVGVAEDWDAHAYDLTNVQDNENAHIGHLDYRCGF